MNALAVAEKVLAIIAEKENPVKRANIFEVLDGIKGAKIVNIVSVTEPTLSGGKSNRFYNRVLRVANANVQINYDYENATNNVLAKQGEVPNFEAGSTWYSVVTDEKGRLTPWARHKKTDELYLRYRLLRNNSSCFIDKTSGQEIAQDVIEQYMRKPSQPLVAARTMALNNVKAVVVGGVTYVTV